MFDAKNFMQQVAAAVRAQPALASRLYAAAGQRFRAEAQLPVNRRSTLALQQIANRLDTLSAQSGLPQTDWLGDEYHIFSDDPRGQVVTEIDGAVADIAASKAGNASELEAAFTQQQLLEARENALAPAVRVTPRSAREGVTQFSQQALVQYGGNNPSRAAGQFGGAASAVSEAPLIRYEGKPNETMPLVIAASIFGGGGANYPSAGFDYRPYLRVQWGSDLALPNVAIVDIARGTQISVAGAFCYVSGGLDAPYPTVAAGSAWLSASLGFFGRSATAPAQRTVYIDQLGAAGTSTNNVPAFATGLLPIQISDTAGSCRIDWKNANGNILYSSSLLVPGSQVSAIPISSDVVTFDLVSTGANTANYRCIFQLSL